MPGQALPGLSRRFEIKVLRRRGSRQPGNRKTLGPAGRVIATLAFGTLAAAVIVLAFLLGYLVLGLAAAALLVAVLVGLLQAILSSLRA